MSSQKYQVDSGLDVLVKEGFSRFLGKRVAILANQASVDKNLDHIVPLALKDGVKLVKLFAPEHGFNGIMQDMEHVGEAFDDRLKLPIISLYGDHKESLKLQSKHLEDVDILLCDLQDIGSRYYTFHCTIAWAMAACQKTNTKLAVIDRPNPINAIDIEGNLVEKTHFSFVGAYPLPNRHGFSMGELVNYVQDALGINFDTEIIWMKNYRREFYFDEINLPFISPSPNMPSLESALVYPGMCLIEGTNLSEGRGTCTPFSLVGAPYLDALEFKKRIDHFDNPGVKVRPCSFKPKFHKFADQDCNGIFIHVLDRKSFRPLRFALSVIKAAMSFEGFDWRHEAYEFETDRLAIDLLLGSESILKKLENQNSLEDIFKMYQESEMRFKQKRLRYLHYQ
ncbi:MAG: DUF1343 domain-containing protein [Myxococcales bacterium]|nr:DUF1343 domain-containing protein [Myxococcales bacterium]USN49990.1 MAG: DUF1343 domain-containing protein [Myxococcales bacterium]